MNMGWQWRFLALFALLSLVGACLLLIKLTLISPLLLGTLVVTSLALGYFGWVIFSGRGRRLMLGWAGLLLSGFLLFSEILALKERSGDNRYLLPALLLLGLYLYLVRTLRGQYQQTLRRLSAVGLNQFKRPFLIINPQSGGGRAIKAGIPQLARNQGIKVIVIKPGDNIEALAEACVRRGADIIGVSGGDGTLGAVATITIKHQLPLVVLPGGTRCHFARDIGLDPEHIRDALGGFFGTLRQVDVGQINNRIFLNNASFGLYGDIVNHHGYREHKLSTSRLVLQEQMSKKDRGYDLKFQDGQGGFYEKAIEILVGINPYETIKIFELGRRSKLDTGKLQITAITDLDDSTVRHLIGSFAFKPAARSSLPENILQWETNKFTVDSGHIEIVVGVDGEREVYAPPVDIKILPRALTLMVPSAGAREKPKSPFSRDVIGELGRAAGGKQI
jgi:diacylglycerol kinase family enzyme